MKVIRPYGTDKFYCYYFMLLLLLLLFYVIIASKSRFESFWLVLARAEIAGLPIPDPGCIGGKGASKIPPNFLFYSMP